MGDASDNLKGVKGIGEKGAVKLIQEFGTIENVYENISNIKGATQTKLIEGKESALLCKEIATIKTDVELPDFEFIQFCPDSKGMDDFLIKYEMFSLRKRVNTYCKQTNSDFSEPVVQQEEKLEVKIIDK